MISVKFNNEYRELKKYDGKLLKAHEGLEKRVNERTASLAKINKQLKKEIEERKKTENERKQLEIKLIQAQKMEAIGTGLGMSVVWGTIKDHKGYINVKSEKEKGTTFMIYLPATREQNNNHRLDTKIEDYYGSNETVLVVDDIKDQREIANDMLTILNYSVVLASSGEEAIEYLKTNTVDILLLDMIMDNGIDGYETYKRILKIHPGQKAIIASGFSETDHVKQAQKLGAGSYIKKPYLLETLGKAMISELK